METILQITISFENFDGKRLIVHGDFEIDIASFGGLLSCIQDLSLILFRST